MKYKILFIPQLGADLCFEQHYATESEAKAALAAIARYTILIQDHNLMPDFSNTGLVYVKGDDGEWEPLDDEDDDASASEDKLSNHSCINKLLNDGYYLKVWCDRYSASIWIAIGRAYSQEFESVCQLTDSADIEASGLSEYLFNTGSWLPFECSETVQESLDALEAKLALLPQDQLSKSSNWAEQYDIALTKILDSADGGYGIAKAIDSGRLPLNPFILSE